MSAQVTHPHWLMLDITTTLRSRQVRTRLRAAKQRQHDTINRNMQSLCYQLSATSYLRELEKPNLELFQWSTAIVWA